MNFQNLFNMINRLQYQAPRQPKQLKKIILKKQNKIIPYLEYQSYPLQIKRIFSDIFHFQQQDSQLPAQRILKINDKLFLKRETMIPICNKVLDRHEPVFRCYDCMTHEASVICKSCFENGSHKGHRYNQISSGGGNCDCGNSDAIKVEGFCKNHPGKADPVEIDEKQESYFISIHLILFEWMFKLYQGQKAKSADQLGQCISTHLLKLNEHSLYYNTLTFKLLYRQRKGLNEQNKLIDYIFQYGIKCVNFAKTMTDVFFNMFSLDIFKYYLSISYTHAYNKYQSFENSKFKSLYIQLFANNDIIQRLLDNQKVVIRPYERQSYDYNQYIQNLMFLSTIKKQVAAKYFLILMKKGIIQIPQMDLIQSNVQEGTEHIVSIINQHLNSLKLTNQDTIEEMVRYYTAALMSNKYSYQKNKVVMPFHKVLAIQILSLCHGDIRKFNVGILQNILLSKKQQNQFVQTPQISAVDIASKSLKLILGCFRQLSITYFETSYFDNYVNLYIKMGNTIIIYDQLMLKICLKIFKQTKKICQMNTILSQVFKLTKEYQIQETKPLEKMDIQRSEHLILDQSQQGDWQDQHQQIYEKGKDQGKIEEEKKDYFQEQLQDMKRNNQLIKIIIEACLTERPQVIISNSIKIQNAFCQNRTESVFSELMNNFKQVSPQNLQLLQKHFIHEKQNFQQNIIKKLLIFDKGKKVYLLNNQLSKQNGKKLPLILYPSMKKVGGIFSICAKQNQPINYSELSIKKEGIQTMKILFNNDFIQELSKWYIKKLKAFSTRKEINEVILSFIGTMDMIKSIMKQETPSSIHNFFAQILSLSELSQFSFLNIVESGQQKKQQQIEHQSQVMKKFNAKKKKRLQQMKMKQKQYTIQQKQQEMKNEDENTCIICREDDKNKGLCFLANFKYSNNLEIINKAEGQSLNFKSCFHPIHIDCFIKTFKSNEFMPCPLCKSISNILIPSEKQLQNKNTISQIYERIITIRTSLNIDYDGFDGKFEQYGILNLLRSIVLMIGKNILKNEPILSEKQQRLANILYNLTKTVFQTKNSKQMAEEVKIIEKFLDILKDMATTQVTQTITNFYLFEYITLKIFTWCLTHKGANSSDILCEPEIACINYEDVRKIWQMCNQIVSLPNFKLRQPSEQIKIVIRPMYEKLDLYIPPKTIKELIVLRDSSEFICKNGHQMCICIICKTKCCFNCKQVKSHFIQYHCSEGLCFNLFTGGFIYYINNNALPVPTYYINSIGIQWKPIKQPQGFEFDYQGYQQIQQKLLNDNLLKYLIARYPELLKRDLLNELV